MKIYIDMIVFLNFFLDFILLLSVSLILKRNVRIYRIVLGAIIGGLSILSLFVSINNVQLFILKVFISIIMVLVTFGFNNIKYTLNNLIYLYLLSIILGGFLYYVNNELSYKNYGIIFFHNGFSINIFIILLLSPIILILYIRKSRRLKEEYAKHYEVEITFLNNKKINLVGFLDTGNDLYDPYKRRPILVINKDILGAYNPRCILVPCYTVNDKSMMKCFCAKKIIVNGKKISKEVLIGISDNNFDIDGAKILLHKNIIKGENV